MSETLLRTEMTSSAYYDFRNTIFELCDTDGDVTQWVRNYERIHNYRHMSLEIYRFSAICAYEKLAKALAKDLENRVTIDAKEPK